MIAFIVVMSNQSKANCGVPAVKQPTVKEPEDSSAPPVVRGPAGLDEGRRGGTGERRRQLIFTKM